MKEKFIFAQNIAKQAGKIANEYFGNYAALQKKEKENPQDMVTEADINVEKFIKSQITEHYPQDGYFGEEEGLDEKNNAFWLVDPIDGTANFVRGLAYYCVSIAYIENQQFVFGVIYDPVLDELFSAMVNEGAHLNGEKIQVENPSWEHSVIGLGRSSRHPEHLYSSLIPKILNSDAEYRRLGAGALSLAHVAAGRLSAFYEPHMNPWDAIAGLYIAKEAGAYIVEYINDDWQDGGVVYAASTSIDEQLRSLINFATDY